MKRRTFLAALGGTLLAPASAVAYRGGLPALYDPYDANPYIRPSRLRPENVDTLIWPAVQRINESGWVWTLESCQGHRGGWSEMPLIRVTTRDPARMLDLLARSAPPHQSLGGEVILPRSELTSIEIERHVEPPVRGWYEARVRAHGPHGIAFFDRFAEAVNKAR